MEDPPKAPPSRPCLDLIPTEQKWDSQGDLTPDQVSVAVAVFVCLGVVTAVCLCPGGWSHLAGALLLGCVGMTGHRRRAEHSSEVAEDLNETSFPVSWLTLLLKMEKYTKNCSFLLPGVAAVFEGVGRVSESARNPFSVFYTSVSLT